MTWSTLTLNQQNDWLQRANAIGVPVQPLFTSTIELKALAGFPFDARPFLAGEPGLAFSIQGIDLPAAGQARVGLEVLDSPVETRYLVYISHPLNLGGAWQPVHYRLLGVLTEPASSGGGARNVQGPDPWSLASGQHVIIRTRSIDFINRVTGPVDTGFGPLA